MCLVMHHTQTHTMTVISTPMMPPKMADAMVVTDDLSDWLSSGVIVVGLDCVLISTDPVACRNGSAEG